MNYPLPTAQAPEIARVQALYRTRYQLELSPDEAKELLERVMQFIYLTEVQEKITEAQEKITEAQEKI